jgi:hypothetical protein
MQRVVQAADARIDVEELARGMYILQAQQNGFPAVHQLFILE